MQEKCKDLLQKGSFLPNLDGPARSPIFSAISSRLVVNVDKSALSPESLLLVTLYTVEMLSGQLTIVGCCLMSLYYKENKKKVFNFLCICFLGVFSTMMQLLLLTIICLMLRKIGPYFKNLNIYWIIRIISTMSLTGNEKGLERFAFIHFAKGIKIEMNKKL